MRQAIQGQIPDEQYQHDPEIKDNEGHTVCYYLWDNGIDVPYSWSDKQYEDPERGEYGDTDAMGQAVDGYIPDKKYYHDPSIQDAFGTVAMYLVDYGVIPPKQWIHDPNISTEIGDYTVRQIMEKKKMPIPNEWYDEKIQFKRENPLFIQQAMYGQIPEKTDDIDPSYQNVDGWTVAMILAYNKIIPPKEWQHDKYLQNYFGDTVQYILYQKQMDIPEYWQYPTLQDDDDNSPAMIQAMNGQIPSKMNYHDPTYRNRNGDTVVLLLIKNNIQVPQEWKYDKETCLFKGRTTAMTLIEQNITPPKEWEHDPELCDDEGNTVAMLLAKKGKNIPEQWKHDKLLINSYGDTVAMCYAFNGTIPPIEWSHDPLIQNYDNQTVGIILAQEGVVPTQYWMHSNKILDSEYQSIQSNLLEYNYFYENGQYLDNVQTQIKDSICIICLEDGEREFIKTKCGHNICIECYRKMIKKERFQRCPVCKKEDWFYVINQNKYYEFLTIINEEYDD